MHDRRASDRAPAIATMLLASEDDPGHLDFGLPQDRAARIAARRAFVELKQLFLRAAEHLERGKGAWLRAQVRAAEGPTDLWVLRNALITALRVEDARTRSLRAELYRHLDNAFPEPAALGLGGLSSLGASAGHWAARTAPTPGPAAAGHGPS